VPPEPPWVLFPLHVPGTLFWRMGAGQAAIGDWVDFMFTLPTVERRLRLLLGVPPAPEGWRPLLTDILNEGELVATLAEADDGDYAREVAADVLVSKHFLTAPDASFSLWGREGKASGRLSPPWTPEWQGFGDNSSPASLLSDWVGLRAFWFWTRLVRATAPNTLDTGAPGPGWRFRRWRRVVALRQPTRSPRQDVQGFQHLALSLLRTGVPPDLSTPHCAPQPKWTTFSPRIVPSVPDMWGNWVVACFDDVPTLDRVLGAAALSDDWKQQLFDWSRLPRPGIEQ